MTLQVVVSFIAGMGLVVGLDRLLTDEPERGTADIVVALALFAYALISSWRVRS